MRRMAVALDLDVSQAVADSMNVRVEGQLTFNTLWRRLRAARAGLGIAFVPEDVADADIDAGRLVVCSWTGACPFARCVGSPFAALSTHSGLGASQHGAFMP